MTALLPVQPLYHKARNLAEILRNRNITVATAESLTGGLISAALTSVPGSSNYFLAGLTAYSNQSKNQLLGVPTEILDNFGAVSSQCALAMARGVIRISCSQLGLSSTGIAGPDGGTPLKPVGLVYLAVVAGDHHMVKECHFEGERQEITLTATTTALNLLGDFLNQLNQPSIGIS